MKTIYYAHCMDIYGTDQENEDICMLQDMGFEVVNPSEPEWAEGWKRFGMNFAGNLLANCHALAFRRAKNGKIPGGVAIEIDIAKNSNIPVIELPDFEHAETMNHEESRAYLKEDPSEFYKKRMAERNE